MGTVSSVAVVTVYLAVLTFVALRARAARKFGDFSLAGRSLPLALVFGSLAATYVGPGFSIGFVGKGFHSGLLFLMIGLAYSAQNILVGLFIAPRLRALKGCHTLGDAIGQKYDRRCQIFAGVISVSICTFLAAVMVYAGKNVLSNIFGLPGFWATIIIVGVTALYTTLGGLRASVITDAFQFSAFAILLPIVLLIVIFCSLDGKIDLLSSEAVTATRSGLDAVSPLEIIGLLAAFLLGETLIPPYANRALASRTTQISRSGFVLAGIFSIIWFTTMIGLGIAARSLIDGDTHEDHVLLELVSQTMPSAGYALLMVVLVSVVMSSLDSLLNAGAVAFTRDLAGPLFGSSDDSALRTGRVATIAIAITAAAVSTVVHSIIEGLLVCYTIWASAILPSLLLGLWIKKPKPRAAILSMSVGTAVAGTAVLCLLIRPSLVQTSIIIVPGLAASVIAYAIGHVWAGKEPEAAT